MSPFPVVIRVARVEDAAELAQVAERAFVETFAADNSPENLAAYLPTAFSPEIQTREISDPASRLLVATREEAIVGYAHLRTGETPACVIGSKPIELKRLYVLAAYHGQGAGPALIEASLETARAAGYSTLWLGVWSRNPKAQHFYQKWQFQQVGEHIFQFGDDPQTDWLMQRDL